MFDLNIAQIVGCSPKYTNIHVDGILVTLFFFRDVGIISVEERTHGKNPKLGRPCGNALSLMDDPANLQMYAYHTAIKNGSANAIIMGCGDLIAEG